MLGKAPTLLKCGHLCLLVSVLRVHNSPKQIIVVDDRQPMCFGLLGTTTTQAIIHHPKKKHIPIENTPVFV
jgi:hypothetical protein